jgi:pSer/pThr/pTyr-binding forkhead associated (FHA) protein
MELTLRVLTGRNAGQVVRVPVTKFLIGRGEDCHLRPHSDLISRHHCSILIDNGVVAVRDFNSKNGTYVNGEKVVGQTTLKTGDQLSVGQLVFEVHASHGDPLQRKPKVVDVRDAAARVAAANVGEDETDVTRWLMEETTAAAAADTSADALTKTQHFSPQEVAELQKSYNAANGTNGSAQEESSAAKTSDSKAGLAGKKGPGKLPPVPVVPTRDSREAAAEMLKKILRNR